MQGQGERSSLEVPLLSSSEVGAWAQVVLAVFRMVSVVSLPRPGGPVKVGTQMKALSIRGTRRSTQVAKAPPIPVHSFEELMRQLACLNHAHLDQCIFYRGQNRDFTALRRRGTSSILPSIYRGIGAKDSIELWRRYARLHRAAAELRREWSVQCLRRPGVGGVDLIRRSFVRWSILQHYEACLTPMLDLTQSPGVACSFALNPDVNGGYPADRHPHVYAFGLPYPTHGISADPEADLVNVRLLSVCPPGVMRPRYQEGFTAFPAFAEPLELSELLPACNVPSYDFNVRLLAKYELVNWHAGALGGGWHRTRDELCLSESPQSELGDTAHEVVKAVRKSIDRADDFMTLHQAFFSTSAELFVEVLQHGAMLDRVALGPWRSQPVSVAHLARAASQVSQFHPRLGGGFKNDVVQAFELRATLLSAHGALASRATRDDAAFFGECLIRLRQCLGNRSKRPG